MNYPTKYLCTGVKEMIKQITHMVSPIIIKIEPSGALPKTNAHITHIDQFSLLK